MEEKSGRESSKLVALTLCFFPTDIKTQVLGEKNTAAKSWWMFIGKLNFQDFQSSMSGARSINMVQAEYTSLEACISSLCSKQGPMSFSSLCRIHTTLCKVHSAHCRILTTLRKIHSPPLEDPYNTSLGSLIPSQFTQLSALFCIQHSRKFI